MRADMENKSRFFRVEKKTLFYSKINQMEVIECCVTRNPNASRHIQGSLFRDCRVHGSREQNVNGFFFTLIPLYVSFT